MPRIDSKSRCVKRLWVSACFLLTPALAWADDPAIGVIGVKDEGTKLTRRRFINYVGAGVSCVDDSVTPETDCTMSGDTTDVGNCDGPACFTGSEGFRLTFEGSVSDNELFEFDAAEDDFRLTNDLNLQDTEPHVRLEDTDASQDDYEWYADGSQVYFTNYTDQEVLLKFDTSNLPYVPSLVSCNTIDTNADGKLVCGVDAGGDRRTVVPHLSDPAGLDVAGVGVQHRGGGAPRAVSGRYRTCGGPGVGAVGA